MKLSRLLVLGVAAAATFSAACGAARAQQDAKSAVITVNPASVIGAVNPLVFGDNIGAADPTNIYPGVDPKIGLHTADGYWDDANHRPDPYVLSHMSALRVGALRYPGGSLVDLYDWHKAVGPLATRGEWHFGIDQYIELCRALHCEPQFILSVFTGSPQDDADLVQYLNSPSNAHHPWAQLRARCGHVAPYHVRLFEIGNETDTTVAYPGRTIDVEHYVAFANEASRRMHAVDPSIKLGAITGTGKAIGDPWNVTVLQRAGKSVDFLIVHYYAVGQDTSSPPNLIMQGCMASADQYADRFRQLHALTRHILGHDLPIALTEYNGGFDAPDPPYRFSYGAALFSNDLIRVLLKPSTGILLANYWHSVNGYWGFLRQDSGPNGPWTTRPAYPLRLLWGQHFGTKLVQTSVASPKSDFPGVMLAQPALGDKLQPSHPIASNLLPVSELARQASAQGMTVDSTGLLTYNLQNVNYNIYQNIATVPTPTAGGVYGCNYALSFDVKVTPSPASGTVTTSLGLADSRGWEATHSAVKIGGAPNDGQWHHYLGFYMGRPDAKSVDALFRIEQPHGTFSGTIQVRNMTLSASTKQIFPAYDLITSSASLSPDGKTLYLIVFNKSMTDDIATTVNVPGARILNAKRWTVTGPDLTCLTTGPGNVEQVETAAATPAQSSHSIAHVFPARSMTAMEISVQR